MLNKFLDYETKYFWRRKFIFAFCQSLDIRFFTSFEFRTWNCRLKSLCTNEKWQIVPITIWHFFSNSGNFAIKRPDVQIALICNNMTKWGCVFDKVFPPEIVKVKSSICLPLFQIYKSASASFLPDFFIQ